MNSRAKSKSPSTRTGSSRYDGQAIADNELLPKLKEVYANYGSDIPVLIKADKATQLQKVADVMNACGDAHMNKFSLQSQ
jgi:biopolymer transport protein ExbD